MEQQEIKDDIDIESAKAKKKYHKNIKKAKNIIEDVKDDLKDEKGQQTSWLGIIVFIIIVLILLRIFGII